MSAPAPAIALRDQVLEILRRHLSTIHAMAVLRAAEQQAGIEQGKLKPSDLQRLIDALRARLPVFVTDPGGVARCMAALDAALAAELGPTSARGSPASARGGNDVMRVEIATEDDIVAARALSRQICQRLGFGTADETKVTTVVSELARNILQYAKRGTIELHRLGVPHLGIEIVARDNGPGIGNLEAVLAGRYRSKLGMGMGLRGSKNLMDDLQVRSALGVGTTVRARKYRR